MVCIFYHSFNRHFQYILKNMFVSTSNNLPFFNSLILNPEKLILKKFEIDLSLPGLKSLKNVLEKYIEIKDKNGRHSEVKFLEKLKKKIQILVAHFPDGIQIEKFNTAFYEYFGHFINPEDYQYQNIVDLLNCEELQDTLLIKTLNEDIIIFNVGSLHNAISPSDWDSSYNHCPLPQDMIEMFKQILHSFGGSIRVDRLVPEYEFCSGKKLNLQDLGVTSIIELVSLLKENFTVYCSNDSEFSIIDKEISNPGVTCDFIENSHWETKENCTTIAEGSGLMEKEVCQRILHILNEFPQGLSLEELEACYRGFFGAHSDDLDPTQYGCATLESLLSQDIGQIQLLREQGHITVVADTICQEQLGSNPSKLSASQVVSFSLSYQTFDQNIILENNFVDVVVADIYNPSKFWIIKHGREYSEALDDLMDRMLVFYGSKIGNRFMIPQNEVVLTFGAPVAAVYTEDLNFYRAIVISMEDVQTVKCFFVDYGTNASVPLSSVRFLHTVFFQLPAQAIKCGLYGIEPVDGRNSWCKTVTAEFLKIVQDKAFSSYIHKKNEDGKLLLTLYDTSHNTDVDICDFLVHHRMAKYKDNISESFRDQAGHSDTSFLDSNLEVTEINPDEIPAVVDESGNLEERPQAHQERFLQDIASQKGDSLENSSSLQENNSLPHSSVAFDISKENLAKEDSKVTFCDFCKRIINIDGNSLNSLQPESDVYLQSKINDTNSPDRVILGITKNHDETFIQDKEKEELTSQPISLSSFDESKTAENLSIVAVILPCDTVIHLVLLCSHLYLPQLLLFSLIDNDICDKLVMFLSSQTNSCHIVELNRSDHFHIFMKFARERISFIYPPDGHIPTRISLISISFLLEFMMNHVSSKHIFSHFLRAVLEKLPPSVLNSCKKQSGFCLSLCLNEDSSRPLTPDGLTRTWKTSLPDNPNERVNERLSLSFSESLLNRNTKKKCHASNSCINKLGKLNFDVDGYHFAKEVTLLSSASFFPSCHINKCQKRDDIQNLTKSSDQLNFIETNDNFSAVVPNESFINTNRFDEVGSQNSYKSFVTSSDPKVQNLQDYQNLSKTLNHLGILLKLLEAQDRLTDNLDLKVEISNYKNAISSLKKCLPN